MTDTYALYLCAAGEGTDRATDAEECNNMGGDAMPGSLQAWSGRLKDGESRDSGDATAESRGERQIEAGVGSSNAAGKGKPAARRALVFVAEGMTATRYLDIWIRAL